MVLRALLWDLDGTVAETEPLHRRAFNLAFAEAGLDIQWDEALYGQLLYVGGGRERLAWYLAHVPRHVPAGSEISELAALLHERKNAFYRELVSRGEAKARPGVARLMREATDAGVTLAICTTSGRGNVLALLASLGMSEGDFSLIASADEAPLKKPAPDVYLHALGKLGLDPKECLAFEDTPNGLAAARAAGIATVVTPSLYAPQANYGHALVVTCHLGDPDIPCRAWKSPSPQPLNYIDLASLRGWLRLVG